MDTEAHTSPLRASLEAIGVMLFLPVATTIVAILATVTGLFNPIFAATGTWLAVILCGFLLKREDIRWRDLGFKMPDNIGKSILFGVGAMIASFLIVGVVISGMTAAGLPVPDTSLFGFLEGNTAIYVPFMILIVWGSAAIGEELLARGFLLNRFEIVFKSATKPWLLAAVAQAVLFGLAHFYQGPSGIIITGIVGFVLAVAYQFTGRNLVAPIIAHGLIDTVSITSIYLGVTP
jgi:membrane protease YdiL (CAAX protease family)